MKCILRAYQDSDMLGTSRMIAFN